MIFMLLFWGVIIALVIFFIRQATTKSSSEDRETPLGIAKIRYASGKISKEEFDRLRSGLQ